MLTYQMKVDEIVLCWNRDSTIDIRAIENSPWVEHLLWKTLRRRRRRPRLPPRPVAVAPRRQSQQSGLLQSKVIIINIISRCNVRRASV